MTPGESVRGLLAEACLLQDPLRAAAERLEVRVMSQLGLWLGLGMLLSLSIGHSHGWFWFDDSKDKDKVTPTPAYVTTASTAVFATAPRTEHLKSEVAHASKVEVSTEGEELGSGGGSGAVPEGSAWDGQLEAEVRPVSGLQSVPGSGAQSPSGSKVGNGSGFALKPISGSLPQEDQQAYGVQTNLSNVVGENVLSEDVKLETGLAKAELSQTDTTTDSGLTSNFTEIPIHVNVSFESISSRNTLSRNSSVWHADRYNTTQYSPEYSVSSNLLTAGGDHSFLARPSHVTESPRCLPIDSELPFCSRMGLESFAVPNFLNQSSVEEAEVLLREWAWLMRSGCHHATEWFFCLLVLPRCGPPSLPPQLPCRSFCELLYDSCWTLLGDSSRLPVECSSLPEESDDGYQCLSVSTQKGKSRLECHLSFWPLWRDAF